MSARIDTEAIVVDRTGGLDALSLRPLTLSAPAPGEARVRIEAAGVAYADIAMRQGVYPGVRPPFIAGYDCVGVVEAIGEEAEHYVRPGDRVCAVTVTGSCARHINVLARLLVKAPTQISAEKVIAATMNGLTAWQMLTRLASPHAGEWALVHGAAGGAGSILLELARTRGVHTIGSASRSKHPLIEAAGGVPVDYRTEDFVARARAISSGGVVAAFDHIGGAHLRRSLTALRAGGVAVSYGFYEATQGGRIRPLSYLSMRARSTIDAFGLFKAGKSLATYNVQTWRDHRADAYRSDLAAVMAMLAEGSIDPPVDSVFPLERTREAQSRLEAKAAAGKIVLTC